MKVSGVEETESQQDTSRYAQRKVGSHSHLLQNVSQHLDQDPSALEISFQMGGKPFFCISLSVPQ